MEIAYSGPVLFPFTFGREGGLTVDGHHYVYDLQPGRDPLTVWNEDHIAALIREGRLRETAKWETQYLPVHERTLST